MQYDSINNSNSKFSLTCNSIRGRIMVKNINEREVVFFAFCDTCGILLASEKPLPGGRNLKHEILPGKSYCSKHEKGGK